MCKSWVLTFQRLASDDLRRLSSKAAEIGAVVNAVPTRYRLIGEPPLDTRTVQDYIYTATRILLREDRDDPDNPAGHVFLERLCGWLTRDHGLSCSGATRG